MDLGTLAIPAEVGAGDHAVNRPFPGQHPPFLPTLLEGIGQVGQMGATPAVETSADIELRRSQNVTGGPWGTAAAAHVGSQVCTSPNISNTAGTQAALPELHGRGPVPNLCQPRGGGEAPTARLLGSTTMAQMVSILRGILADSPALVEQMERVVERVEREVDSGSLTTEGIKQASSDLLKKLGATVGWGKVKRAIFLQRQGRAPQHHYSHGQRQQQGQQVHLASTFEQQRQEQPASPPQQQQQQQQQPAEEEQAGPPSNFTIILRLPSGEVRPYRMPRQFFAAHPSKWRAWTSTPSLHLEMWAEYAQWHAANRGDAAKLHAALSPAAQGQTALHLAAASGQVSEVLSLLRMGASLATRDANGCTPLHAAVAASHTAAISALMSAGADPAAADARGCTPLHTAAAAGSAEAIRALLAYPATHAVLGICDLQGRLAQDIAVKGGHSRVVQVLQEAAGEASQQAKHATGADGSQDNERSDACAICMDGPCQMVLDPCGHLVLCSACANQLLALPTPSRRLCPVCRTQVVKTLRVFK